MNFVMVGLVYFVCILFANTIGAISGMGGGVIIKPALDALAFHDLTSIGLYSSIAVFTMSLVSTNKQLKDGIDINLKNGAFVALGSIVGGVLGSQLFQGLLNFFGNEKQVQLIQIILMVLSLVFVLVYTNQKWDSLKLSSMTMIVLVGVFLGAFSTLLGIGGGPINVALLMFLFGLPIKLATGYSIVIILFSQLAKLTQSLFIGQFATLDLNMLLFIIPAAIIGGYLGSKLNQSLSDERVMQVYQWVCIGVIILNVYNGVMLFV